MTTPTSTGNNGLDGLAEGPEGDTPMSFWDHLGELRSRLVKAAFGVTISVVLCFIYATELREFLAWPLHKAWVAANMPGKPELQVLAMMDAFMTDMRVAMTGGIFLATPILFYQFWMFIAPGLYAKEKRFAIPFVTASVFMFLLGAAFCYYAVLPWTIQWLLSYTQSTSAQTAVVYNLTLNDYIRDATKILVAFGAVFEFPLLVAFLAFAGVLTHRGLLRFWKISVVLIFIIAAFLTPPEPVSQLMMAIPMTLLFFASVGIAYLIDKSKSKSRALQAAEAAAAEAAEAAAEAAQAAAEAAAAAARAESPRTLPAASPSAAVSEAAAAAVAAETAATAAETVAVAADAAVAAATAAEAAAEAATPALTGHEAPPAVATPPDDPQRPA